MPQRKRNWLQNLLRRHAARKEPAASKSRNRRRLLAEILEQRQLLAADLPGDQLAMAQVVSLVAPITVSDTIGNGVHGDKDVDLYRVTLSAGQSLTIDIDTPTSSLDSFIRVFNHQGIEQANANDENPSNVDSLLVFTAPFSNTYYIGVSGYSNISYIPTTEASGIAASTGAYQMTLTPGVAPAPDFPQDTLSTAPAISLTSGPVTLNEAIGDGVNWNRDVDLYKVTLNAGQSLSVAVNTPSSNLDSYVKILDSAGIELAANNDLSAFNTDSFLTYTAPTTGTYYVGVSGYSNINYQPTTAFNQIAASTGDYTIRTGKGQERDRRKPIDSQQSIGPVILSSPQGKRGQIPAHLNPILTRIG